MIVTYELVNDSGELNGGEVSFRFKDVVAIENMHSWQVRDSQEYLTLVPDCTTVHVRRTSFHVKMDYRELLAAFKEHYERYE